MARPVDSPPERASLVQIKVGDRYLDAVHQPRCKTCTHPARLEIEKLVVENYSFRAIANQFSNVEHARADGTAVILPEIKFQSIRNHYMGGHMPLETTSIRQLADERGRELGLDIEALNGKYVDQYILAQTVVHQVHEGLTSGELRAGVKEGLAAAKLLASVEQTDEQNQDLEDWSQAMTVYFETAQQIMPADMFAKFTAQLRVNPILRGIAERKNNPTPALEGSVVTEEDI